MEESINKNFIVFSLCNIEYAVDISYIKEIIKLREIVQVPKSPDFVEGIVQLRDEIVAIIDLAKRLKIDNTSINLKKRKIIIVNLVERILGLQVDSVGEVLKVSDDQIHPVPQTIATVDINYLKGVIKIEDRVILLMNIDKILSVDELCELAANS